jgi:hypothetical protein
MQYMEKIQCWNLKKYDKDKVIKEIATFKNSLQCTNIQMNDVNDKK